MTPEQAHIYAYRTGQVMKEIEVRYSFGGTSKQFVFYKEKDGDKTVTYLNSVGRVIYMTKQRDGSYKVNPFYKNDYLNNYEKLIQLNTKTEVSTEKKEARLLNKPTKKEIGETGMVVSYQKILYMIVRRIYPEVYELAPIHWNTSLLRYIGESTNRLLVVHRNKWIVEDIIPKEEWTRVLRPSDSYIHYGYRSLGNPLCHVDSFVEKYEKRNKITLDKTNLVVPSHEYRENTIISNFRVTHGLIDPIYEKKYQ